MQTFIRYGAGSGIALLITAGLGLCMAGMIAVEFAAQDKPGALTFDINPVAEDIAPPPDVTPPKPFAEVETPPPPTKIETKETTKVAINPHQWGDELPPMELPDIKLRPINASVIDTHAQPILRPAPPMPPRAEKSGHCKVRFDVSSEGAPYNIQATSCSEKIFERSSIKAVQRWKFKPKVQGGQRVAMSGVQNQITFRLTDERGRIIPE